MVVEVEKKEEKKKGFRPESFDRELDDRDATIYVWDGVGLERIEGHVRTSKYFLKVHPRDNQNVTVYVNKAFLVKVEMPREAEEEEKEEKEEEKKGDEEIGILVERIEEVLGTRREMTVADIASVLGKDMDTVKEAIKAMKNPFVKQTDDRLVADLDRSLILVNRVRNAVFRTKEGKIRLDRLAVELNVKPEAILGAMRLNKIAVKDIEIRETKKEGLVVKKVG